MANIAWRTGHRHEFPPYVLTSPDRVAVVEKNLHCMSNRTMLQQAAQESKVYRRLAAIPGIGHIFSYADICGELLTRTTRGSDNVVLSSDSLGAYADTLESGWGEL